MVFKGSLSAWRLQLERTSGYKWLLLALLFLVATLNYADRTAFTPVFPLLKQDLGMSDLGLAAIGSFFLWSYAAASPFAGYFGDRFSRRSLIIGSLVAWSLVTALTAFVTTAGQLLAMRLLLGVSEALYMPAAIALLAQFHAGETRGTAMGVHLAGFQIGVVAGGTLAGYFGDLYGWRPAVLGLGTLGLALALLCYFLMAEPSSRALSSEADQVGQLPIWTTICDVAKVASYWVLAGEAMLISVGVWIFTNWLPLYFKESFSLSLGQAGFSGTATVTLGVVIGILGGGWLSDRVAKQDAGRRMLLHSACDLAAVPFLFVFWWSNQRQWIAIAIFCFSLMRALGQANAVPVLYEVLKPRTWSTAIGLMNTTNCLAGGAGILLAGFLKTNFGLKWAFVGVSAVVFVAGLLLFIGYKGFLRADLRRSLALPVATSIHKPLAR